MAGLRELFRRRRTDAPTTAPTTAPTAAPTAEPGTVAGPDPEPGWRQVAPLTPVVSQALGRPAPRRTLEFLQSLPTRWHQPPAVAPLGHDVRPEVSGGVLTGLVRPVVGAGTAAAGAPSEELRWLTPPPARLARPRPASRGAEPAAPRTAGSPATAEGHEPSTRDVPAAGPLPDAAPGHAFADEPEELQERLGDIEQLRASEAPIPSFEESSAAATPPGAPAPIVGTRTLVTRAEPLSAARPHGAAVPPADLPALRRLHRAEPSSAGGAVAEATRPGASPRRAPQGAVSAVASLRAAPPAAAAVNRHVEVPAAPDEHEPFRPGTAAVAATSGHDAAGPDASGPDAAGPDASGPDASGPDGPVRAAVPEVAPTPVPRRVELDDQPDAPAAAPAGPTVTMPPLRRAGRRPPARRAATPAEPAVRPRHDVVAAAPEPTVTPAGRTPEAALDSALDETRADNAHGAHVDVRRVTAHGTGTAAPEPDPQHRSEHAPLLHARPLIARRRDLRDAAAPEHHTTPSAEAPGTAGRTAALPPPRRPAAAGGPARAPLPPLAPGGPVQESMARHPIAGHHTGSAPTHAIPSLPPADSVLPAQFPGRADAAAPLAAAAFAAPSLANGLANGLASSLVGHAAESATRPHAVASSGGNTAAADHDPAALDRLAGQLYGRLRSHLASDLLVGRERAQLLTDL